MASKARPFREVSLSAVFLSADSSTANILHSVVCSRKEDTGKMRRAPGAYIHSNILELLPNVEIEGGFF